MWPLDHVGNETYNAEDRTAHIVGMASVFVKCGHFGPVSFYELQWSWITMNPLAVFIMPKIGSFLPCTKRKIKHLFCRLFAIFVLLRFIRDSFFLFIDLNSTTHSWRNISSHALQPNPTQAGRSSSGGGVFTRHHLIFGSIVLVVFYDQLHAMPKESSSAWTER